MITNGVTPGISATTGANTVISRAVTLQKPKAEAVKIVGISYTLAIKQRLKADAMPNLATDTNIGIH